MAEKTISSNDWTTTRLLKLFKRDPKSKQSLLNAENKKKIPAPQRNITRGNNKIRIWDTSQVPEIGKVFGFLQPPINQKVITFFTSKGGVLKTTLAHETARILALNGIKVIIIGLDIQCSITDIVSIEDEAESLEDVTENIGLYHFLCEGAKIEEIIKNTDLPTLDYIPETTDLNALEKRLRDSKKREQVFKNKLIKQLKNYDVIIFDNSPSWNLLIENALSIANAVIAPVGCDINTWRSLQTNLDNFWEFYNEMCINLEHFFLVPTLLDSTKLSQQIYGAYLNQFKESTLALPIKRSIVGQEASAQKRSIIEYSPASQLALNYFALIEHIWESINTKDKNPKKTKNYSKQLEEV